jgi:cation diffusion facilitator CzcD-associated flavoprotein CzcO
MAGEQAARQDQALNSDLDVAVIGAGFAGMYAVHRLRQLGLAVKAFDEAASVGGTWWWNTYPGARVDVPGAPFYCYTFSEELVQEWDWQETQPDQSAVLAYLNNVADKLQLRQDIELGTRVEAVQFDEGRQCWVLRTSRDEQFIARFLVCAVGTLSASAVHAPTLPGIGDFTGPVVHTGRWPQDEDFDLGGKRVGIIGTGSSAIQAIPIIAREAAHLTVFQRTPQFSIPARTREVDPDLVRTAKASWPEIRKRMLQAPHGGALEPTDLPSALEHTAEERHQVFEAAWQRGGMALYYGCYRDILTNPEANATVSEFLRSKIREVVEDPDVARKLLPFYYFGTKRPVMDEGYYETFNRQNVSLVDLREDPIEKVSADGVRTTRQWHELDVLVFATGYDAVSGALRRLNPGGRGDATMAAAWETGVRTHLGMMVADFPNLFMLHGPQSPSGLFHMPLGAELQVEWVARCIRDLEKDGLATIEPTHEAELQWNDEVEQLAAATLYPQTDSWYTGANIPGKPREFLIHLGGPKYHQRLIETADKGYPGFVRQGDGKRASRAS